MPSACKNGGRNRVGYARLSVARPFLHPFSVCATTFPRKWRRGSGHATRGYSGASTVQPLKAETPRNRSIASAYVAILRLPTELRLIRPYLSYGYGRTTARVRAYYDYGYGRTTTMATGVLLRLRTYYSYGYGRTMATTMGVLYTTEAMGERTGVLR